MIRKLISSTEKTIVDSGNSENTIVFGEGKTCLESMKKEKKCGLKLE